MGEPNDNQNTFTDADRLDWLQRMAEMPGGLLLHNGHESGRTGLGLSRFGRTLRQAIDDCLMGERVSNSDRAG